MRIFAFGCSLTQYFYPTWADLLITHYEDTHQAPGMNWGRSGAGNQYIVTKLWEANALHKFTKEDIILIQWSNMFREDRYHEDNGWYCPGGFGERNTKKEEFELNGFKYEDEMQWADQIHCVMRDCALIASTKLALNGIGCKVVDTGFRDWKEGLQSKEFKEQTLLGIENAGTIIDTYGDIVNPKIRPILNALHFSVSEEFFKTRPLTVPSLDNKEGLRTHTLPEIHPLPLEHLDFVERFVCPALDINSLHENVYELANKYNDKIKDKDVIVLKDLAWANLEQIGFSDDGWRP